MPISKSVATQTRSLAFLIAISYDIENVNGLINAVNTFCSEVLREKARRHIVWHVKYGFWCNESSE